MLELAQEMYKLLQDRFRTTLRVVADLAESVGVPPKVTSLLHGIERADTTSRTAGWVEVSTPVASTSDPRPPVEVEETPPAQPAQKVAPPARRRNHSKRRRLEGSMDLSDNVQRLEVDDAINGSTYLARIVWTLGVAQMEGIGPLRPADMARMIMSRSAVSLEPPNVARYIRRSNSSCIIVDHTEGSSNFYALSAEGLALFNEKYLLKR
jgi:hypothetical protein